MGIEEGTFWDEHWVLHGNQFDNKFHIKKKQKKETASFNPVVLNAAFRPEALRKGFQMPGPSPCF